MSFHRRFCLFTSSIFLSLPAFCERYVHFLKDNLDTKNEVEIEDSIVANINVNNNFKFKNIEVSKDTKVSGDFLGEFATFGNIEVDGFSKFHQVTMTDVTFNNGTDGTKFISKNLFLKGNSELDSFIVHEMIKSHDELNISNCDIKSAHLYGKNFVRNCSIQHGAAEKESFFSSFQFKQLHLKNKAKFELSQALKDEESVSILFAEDDLEINTSSIESLEFSGKILTISDSVFDDIIVKNPNNHPLQKVLVKGTSFVPKITFESGKGVVEISEESLKISRPDIQGGIMQVRLQIK